jgi:hypothetical protein
MTVNREVNIAMALWKNKHPNNINEKYHAHRLSKLFEDSSNNNVLMDAHDLSRDIFYLSILFYLTGVTALVYLVINS